MKEPELSPNAISRPITIARTKQTREKEKNADKIRRENNIMLEQIYYHCKHNCETTDMLRTLGDTELIKESKHIRRESIRPATVRTLAPPDWEIDVRYVWYSGEQCVITI